MAHTRLQHKMMWIITAALLIMVPLLSGAAEVQFPVAAYTPEEQAKVREWEKTWAGKKIDKSTIDQVAEFMPESYVNLYRNPDQWGGPKEGLYFTIVPYQQIIETKGVIEATKKYVPLVKTDAAGKITNYADLAGFPFPDPKTGLEIAYNTDFQTRGDTYHMRWWAPVIDPRQRTDRTADQEFTEMYFAHRTEVQPKPAIPENSKGYLKGQFLHFYLPPEMMNTRFSVMKFIDDTKEYESYLYYAQFRRIRRVSTAERTNALDGTDMIYDDGNMWDGYLLRNTYTYKGKKELLLARHNDMEKTTRQVGQAIANGYQFERCNTYVVEVVNQDPNYIYSKRVWYIDPETFWIHWQEMYDQMGRLWKCYCQPTNNFKTAIGDTKNFMCGFMMLDLQRKHGGHTHMKIKGISINVDENIFSLTNLQRTY